MTPTVATDTARPTRSGEELDQKRLNEYLRQHAPGVGLVLEISKFPGGYSNLTYCLRTAEKEYVLRRPPFGANIKSAHDMGREFRVLSLLKGHYAQIPNPVVYCESSAVMGAPFYVMERINGVILRAAQAPKLNLPNPLLRRISESLINNLVAIHALDIGQAGLIQLGKPEGYVQRQVEGWIKRYYQAETDKIPALDAAADWLPKNLPPEQAPAFLHNDYKHDNVVLQADNLSRIIGVLDWEMATVGDPLMDLGATLAYWTEAGDEAAAKSFNLTWLPGNLTRAEVIERYARQSGRDLSNIRFYYVFGLFKNATIAQQIYARWKQGLTQDARFGGLIGVIKALANKVARSLESGRI